MPYASQKQNAWMHINKPDIAARWDKEMKSKKKYKISVNNKLKGALGQMDPKTNEIQINVKKHKGDKAELASTIKHELMHVKKPKATEKEVYKATRKTKIPPAEQSKLISKLRHKRLNYKLGAVKRKLKFKGDINPGDLIKRNNELNPKTRTAIMGMV